MEAGKSNYWLKGVAILLLGLGIDVLLSLSGLPFLQPSTGYYGGYYFTEIHQDDGVAPEYSLRITGKAKPQWHWYATDKLIYERVQLSWYRSVIVPDPSGSSSLINSNRPSSGSAEVDLLSMNYQTEHSHGVLTVTILADWLLLGQPRPLAEQDLKKLDAILANINAAASGTLPPPDRKMHKLDDLSSAQFHSRDGFGVTVLGYAWIAVWAFAALKIWRKRSNTRINLTAAKITAT